MAFGSAKMDSQIRPPAGFGDFWTAPSFEELTRLQGVRPVEAPEVLAGGFPEDDDIDEFLDDIYRHR